MTPKAFDLWTSFCNAALDLAYPRKCSLCGLFSPANPCVQCQGELEPLEARFIYEEDHDLAFRGAIYHYRGRGGQAVRLLKYSRRTGLAPFMARSIAHAIDEEGLEYDVAVPVPIHRYRRAARGFNQAEMLSARLADVEICLKRTRFTAPQAGLSPERRLTNLQDAFSVCRAVEGKQVLLIDDVFTSGQTARECAKTLRRAGAAEVGIVTFCGQGLP